MTKTVITGKQIKEFLDKFSADELVTMAANINKTIGEAAETFYNTVNKLANTYPELWAFCNFSTSLIASDGNHGEFVHIHLGPRDKEDFSKTRQAKDIIHNLLTEVKSESRVVRQAKKFIEEA